MGNHALPMMQGSHPASRLLTSSVSACATLILKHPLLMAQLVAILEEVFKPPIDLQVQSRKRMFFTRAH